MADAPSPIHVGVDDWAMRKGCRDSTIVVDLDRHRVIDLLPDRPATTLAGWLERRPDIRVVARHRASEYARGVNLGAPRALQVADRWHLLANMRQAVERWLHGAHAQLRGLTPAPGSADLPPRRDHAFPGGTPELDAGAESWTRWRAIYDEVRRGRAGGETLLGIARAMGLARATVRKYAAADIFPARLPHGAGSSLLDVHVGYLVRRIGEGCENAMALWREIRERGYPGTSRHVHRFVAERLTKPIRSGRKPRNETVGMPERPAAGSPLPTARQLAWLLVQPTMALDAAAAAVVTHVEQDETAKAVAGLARRFTALVRASGVNKTATEGRASAAELDRWIASEGLRLSCNRHLRLGTGR